MIQSLRKHFIVKLFFVFKTPEKLSRTYFTHLHKHLAQRHNYSVIFNFIELLQEVSYKNGCELLRIVYHHFISRSSPSLLSMVLTTKSDSKVSCICCPRKWFRCSSSMRSLSSSSKGSQVPSTNHWPLITGIWSCSAKHTELIQLHLYKKTIKKHFKVFLGGSKTEVPSLGPQWSCMFQRFLHFSAFDLNQRVINKLLQNMKSLNQVCWVRETGQTYRTVALWDQDWTPLV